MAKDNFLKEFKEKHKEEIEEINKIQTILNEIKNAEKSKVQYFTQISFKVE